MTNKDFFSTGEAARITGLSQRTIINYCIQGKLDAIQARITNYRKIHRESLLRFMREHDIPFDNLDSKIKILIIDDEPNVVDSIKWVLEQKDKSFLLDTASDGYEGCIKVGLFRPDIVILDLMMPKADGFEVCKTIKENPALDNTHIIIVTGYKTMENVQKLEALGIKHVLGKPFNPDELVKIIDEDKVSSKALV